MQHDGAQAAVGGPLGALNDLLWRHPVARQAGVVGANAAVEAVAAAVVGELEQSS